MSISIPRPPSSSTPPTLPPERLALLRRGIILRQSPSWRIALLFMVILGPLLWLFFSWLLTSIHPLAFRISTAALYSLLLAPLLYLPFYLFMAYRPSHHRLRLREETVLLETPKATWSLDPSHPFFLALFYRSEREDALLLLQSPSSPEPCFLYGPWPSDIPVPPGSIPFSWPELSLAAFSLDTLAAHQIPHAHPFLLSDLTALLSSSPHLQPKECRLPLSSGHLSLRLEASALVFLDRGDPIGKIPFASLRLQPFALPSSQGVSLLFSLDDATATSPGVSPSTSEPTTHPAFWVAAAWPLPLRLPHLPLAPQEAASSALYLPCPDILLFLSILNRRGVLAAPFSLLQGEP